jgi:uncharacterized SAM-binding protein YcdF (DUF218 family)
MARMSFRWFRRLTGLALMAWAVTIAMVWGWSRRDDAAGASARVADAIIVLGAAQYAGRPSPVLQARLDHARALYERGLSPYVLLTGGRGDGDTQSEAGAGRRYLVQRGIPAGALLSEDEGRTTFASMRHAADTLTRVDATTVLLVSDPFHMLRLSLLARLHGLTPRVSPTRTSPISRQPLLAFEYAVRESLAVPADLLQFARHSLDSEAPPAGPAGGASVPTR